MIKLDEIEAAQKQVSELWNPVNQIRSILLATTQLQCFTGTFCDPEKNAKTIEDVMHTLEACIGLTETLLNKHEKLECIINGLEVHETP